MTTPPLFARVVVSRVLTMRNSAVIAELRPRLGHGGIVSQFVGDEVLALFGVDTAHEDDPVRAVRSAFDLHAAARHLSDELDSSIGESLAMHTGI